MGREVNGWVAVPGPGGQEQFLPMMVQGHTILQKEASQDKEGAAMENGKVFEHDEGKKVLENTHAAASASDKAKEASKATGAAKGKVEASLAKDIEDMKKAKEKASHSTIDELEKRLAAAKAKRAHLQ